MFLNTGDGVAKVVADKGDHLYVQFLSSSRKSYKGAKVYSFEESVEMIDTFETKHSSMEELGFKKVQDNMYVELEEVDEDSSSEVESDEESSSDEEDDFIVPDDEDVMIKPPDHRAVDDQWNSWRPSSAGARRFKEKVDQIEAYMNHAIDEKFVFKN
jgi:hypothetical protein